MSKTYYNLYDKICHPLNLWWAYKAAARGKRYQPAAAFFEYDLEKNLIEMERSNERTTISAFVVPDYFQPMFSFARMCRVTATPHARIGSERRSSLSVRESGQI